MGKGKRGKFFAIDRHQWPLVCDLGMNAALLYLVIACGTCPKNLISRWSANALEKYAGIARKRAKVAREILLSSPYVEAIENGKSPKYELTRSDDFDQTRDFIWLPNQVVTGIETEVPAIQRIRQTGDSQMLRLYIELFYEQNLVDDCGISRHIFSQNYTRKHIADSGPYVVWGFSEAGFNCPPANDMAIAEVNNSIDLRFERVQCLIDLGLIEIVPYLCEGPGPDDEIIHPMIARFDTADLYIETEEAAQRLLPDQYEHELCCYSYVVPVLRHFANVTVVGIAQSRHRPKTSLTAAASAKHKERSEDFEKLYQAMGR